MDETKDIRWDQTVSNPRDDMLKFQELLRAQSDYFKYFDTPLILGPNEYKRYTRLIRQQIDDPSIKRIILIKDM
jgi:hypothetical protein